jgi:hypothetical protein
VGTKDVGLAGGDEVVWAYQYRISGDDGLRLLSFAYRLEDDKRRRPTFRKPREFAPVGGQISSVAVRGASLHVIYADGTHRRYHPGGEAVERMLPKSCVPLTLAGDEGLNVLYALVPAGVAAALSHSADQGEPQSETAEDAQIGAPPEPTTAPDAPVTAFAIVRYERGTWRPERDAPDMLQQRRPCRLVARDGICHLFVADDEGQGRILYLRSEQQRWSAAQVVPEIAPDKVLAMAVDGQDALVLVKATSSARGAGPLLIRCGAVGFAKGPSYVRRIRGPGVPGRRQRVGRRVLAHHRRRGGR